MQFVQFTCPSYFVLATCLSYFGLGLEFTSLNNLAWLCSWSYQASYSFRPVEPINPVWAFEQHQPFQMDGTICALLLFPLLWLSQLIKPIN